jgi:hypothetical protein
MVKKDLERVGIPYETEEGIADFRAAGRHTHITELLRNGASLVETKELARHSDIKTTMRYTHIGIKDQARALAGLVAPKGRPSDVKADRENPALHGRCISGISEGRSLSTNGNGSADQKRQNPLRQQGFWQQMSTIVTGWQSSGDWIRTSDTRLMNASIAFEHHSH